MGGEFEDCAFVTVYFVFDVGGGEDGEEESFDTNGWFDDMGDE